MNGEEAIRILLDSEFKNTIPENTGPIEDGKIIIHGEQLDPIKVLESDPDAYKNARAKWLTDKISDAKLYVDEISSIKRGLVGKRIEELSVLVSADSITPFIGSGMSAPCGLPTWGTFLNNARIDAGISDADYHELLALGDYEKIASGISGKINLDLQEELMIHTFAVNSNDEVVGPVRMIPMLFEKSIITTNYDNVIERAYSRFGISFDRPLYGTELKTYTSQRRIRSKILAKIHGDHRSIGTRVLTKEEYDRNYGSRKKFRAALSDIYKSESLFFIGCSLNRDRTLDVFGSVPRNRRYFNHYALLPAPLGDGYEIDTIAINQRETGLTNMGIFPIWYTGDHSQAIENIFIYLLSKKGLI